VVFHLFGPGFRSAGIADVLAARVVHAHGSGADVSIAVITHLKILLGSKYVIIIVEMDRGFVNTKNEQKITFLAKSPKIFLYYLFFENFFKKII
jgi:hypothetical protein